MPTKGSRILPRRLVALLIPLVVLGLPSCARAHVIPNDATMVVLLKPEGDRLRLLVRVPLATMLDLDYPVRGGGQEFLDLDRADRILREAVGLWIIDNVELYEASRRLPPPQLVDVRAALAFDGSFASYEQAFAHLNGPRLTNNVDFVWNQGFLDMRLEYPIQSARSQFSIHSKLSTLALRTTTTLRFLPPAGDIRAFEFIGDPGLIRLVPRWYQAAARFIGTGFQQVLRGTEYCLFLFVLAIPLRRLRLLVPVAISFAAAEAITLIPSLNLAPDTVWFQPLLGVLIAAAIIYMAIENATATGLEHRWMMAFGFGLVLGLRFSFALRQTLQFAGTYPLTSLVSFTVGVALAQMVALVLLMLAVRFVFRFVPEHLGTFVVSLMAGDVAWHWLVDRAELLSQYQFLWPTIDRELLLVTVRWTMDFVIAGAVFWMLFTTIGRFAAGSPASGRSIAEARR